MEQFRFANPEFAYLLIGIPFLIAFIVLANARAKRKLAGFAHQRNLNILVKKLPSLGLKAQDYLFLAALCFLVVALMRPQGNPDGQAAQHEGLDLIFLLDASQSMAAKDLAPSRMDRAKELIGQALGKLNNDQIGLVTVAGGAYQAVPLTKDYKIVESALKNIEPKAVGLQGTNLAQGINVALKAFQNGAHNALNKDQPTCFLVVLSDGEETLGDAAKAAKEARDAGVIIFTLGLGTEAGGTVPFINPVSGQVELKKDKDGQQVVSKLSSSVLTAIAKAADGQYFPPEQAPTAMATVLTLSRELLSKRDQQIDNKRFSEYFDIPTQLAICFLLAYIYLPLLRRKKVPVANLLLIFALVSNSAFASQPSLPWQSFFWTPDRRATELARLHLAAGDAQSAVAVIDKQLSKEGNEVLVYNGATSLANTDNLPSAEQRLSGVGEGLAPFARFNQAGVAKRLGQIVKAKELLFETVERLEKLEGTRSTVQDDLLLQARKNIEFLFKKKAESPEPPPIVPPPEVIPPPPPPPPPFGKETELIDKQLSKGEGEELLNSIDSPTQTAQDFMRQLQQGADDLEKPKWDDW